MIKGSYTYYDLIGHLVPGTILVGFALVIVKWLGWQGLSSTFSSVEALGFGTAIAYIIGILIQGISSWCESTLHRLWGGRPSVKAVKKGLSKESKSSLNQKYIIGLSEYFKLDSPDENPQILFQLAKDYVNRKALGRAELFNSMYALGRAMLTVSIIISVVSAFLIISDYFDWFSTLNWICWWITSLMTGLVLVILFYFITRDKAYDYVNEVIGMAGNSLIG